ncbi:hypothetical protein NEA10_11710 [Phormidium yuhuli AB48]|uniref:Uncharacterized protein n=1 Tax=Phormidium yuhuli AB48 TaxID=2940671 RepID=A0ABY5AKC2_9CYAN|nr:hypothetical protein [Phormidium yuhuli]USR89552.1 hypothetical protein NEA10_11710 [Phormidium yuhuli AB48]
MNDSDKILGIPKSLAKIIGGLVIFFAITSLLSSQICIFSTCTTEGPVPGPEPMIGAAVTLILMTMFPISIGPALLSGLGVWFILENLGWLQML